MSAFGHAFVQQHLPVVSVLAYEGYRHRSKGCAGFRGIRQPNFGRIPFAIQFRGFDSPQGHAPADDNDGLGFIKGVFHDEPAANAEEKDHGTEQQEPDEAKHNAASSLRVAELWLSELFSVAIGQHPSVGWANPIARERCGQFAKRKLN